MNEHTISYDYSEKRIDVVMDDVETYIIPENRKIVQYLWDKNILTRQTNTYTRDYDEEKESWIVLGDLSEENEKIISDWINENYDHEGLRFEFLRGKIILFAPHHPKSGDSFESFKPLVDILKFQDVQKDGFLTEPQFMIEYTNCWEVIPNPKYNNQHQYSTIKEPERIPPPIEIDPLMNTEDPTTGQELPRIKVVDEKKMDKTIGEYIKDAGLFQFYIPEERKIYLNERLYEGHMRYLEVTQKDKKTNTVKKNS